HHVLTYQGSSTAVVNALKGLAANVNNCWNGAGTWMQPAKPNNVQHWEGPQSNNLAEDCRYKEAYVTTKETRRFSDGMLLSRTYTIGCFRLDPAPAQLTANL